jgi:hypothetical protein
MRASLGSLRSLTCLSLLLAGLAGLAGCPDRTVAELPPAQAGEISKDIPVTVEIDLLFVIDNSGSTKEKQTVFAANFPRFIEALEAFDEGLPNLHIGVVSTTVDLGVGGIEGCPHPAPNDDGLLHNRPSGACAPPDGRFIVDVADAAEPDGRRQNYTDELDKTLSCIAQIGSTGCGFESPLEAMKRALDGTRPENAGFLRKNAFLVVVFLVDEDDASIGDPAFFGAAQTSDFRAQPLLAYRCDQPISPTGPGSYTGCRPRTDSFLTDPARYYELLSTLKPPGRTIVALIGGDPRPDVEVGPLTINGQQQALALLPSCSATIDGKPAIGRPAIRLADFTSRFGDSGLFRSICQPDYSQTLADIGALIDTKVSPCLEGQLATDDVAPDEPGLQLECNVSDVVLEPEEREALIPPCAMQDAATPRPGGERPCWWSTPNPAACATTATQLELHVERTSPAAPGTSVRARCATRGT